MAEKKTWAVYAEFYRKPADSRELKSLVFSGEKWKVQVEKVVELSEEDFNRFQESLYEYYEFLYENGGFMYFDDQDRCAHSLLVTTPECKTGILVQAEGFPYVRYGAYVPDCGVFDLSAVPLESRVPRQIDPEQEAKTRKPKKQKRERGER